MSGATVTFVGQAREELERLCRLKSVSLDVALAETLGDYFACLDAVESGHRVLIATADEHYYQLLL